MTNQKQKKNYMPFTYKMMIPYLILVLMTDVFIGYISYSMLIQSRTEMAETNIRTAMEQTRNNLKYQLDEIQRMSDTFFGSQPFQRALQTKGDSLEVYLTMLDEIVPQMQAPLHLFGNHIRLAVSPLSTALKRLQITQKRSLRTKKALTLTTLKRLTVGNGMSWIKFCSSRKMSGIL